MKEIIYGRAETTVEPDDVAIPFFAGNQFD